VHGLNKIFVNNGLAFDIAESKLNYVVHARKCGEKEIIGLILFNKKANVMETVYEKCIKFAERRKEQLEKENCNRN
jgi:hypothetical protein